MTLALARVAWRLLIRAVPALAQQVRVTDDMLAGAVAAIAEDGARFAAESQPGPRYLNTSRG